MKPTTELGKHFENEMENASAFITKRATIAAQQLSVLLRAREEGRNFNKERIEEAEKEFASCMNDIAETSRAMRVMFGLLAS